MTREEAFREAFMLAALRPYDDRLVVSQRVISQRNETARMAHALVQEQHFRLTHPDYDEVCGRAGIWRVVALVQQGVPLTPAQQEIVALIRTEPNPAEAAYGLALTRIAMGETE